MRHIFLNTIVIVGLVLVWGTEISSCQEAPECELREFQYRAAELEAADWIHWGDRADKFSSWTSHSNRLIPVYSWGIDLQSVKGKNSIYRDEAKLQKLYGALPPKTLNPKARYFDQTQIYEIQKQAWKAGKKNVILMVFDGMDWNTTQAASIYRHKEVLYEKGRGTGLAFLDYKKQESDFGFCVTSPYSAAFKYDVDAQAITEPLDPSGGYSIEFGGNAPWKTPGDPSYLLSKRKTLKHQYTDSASSATSMNSGLKTYNASINISPDGKQITTLAHEMQAEGFAIGVVTSVPISHATPACVYSHNVSRNDYQDLTRDLLGLNSASHRTDPLSGVDVLIGGGWGQTKDDDREKQGANFVPGNTYLTDSDIQRIALVNGGKYRVAQRTPGENGTKVLSQAATQAAKDGTRLLGYFGRGGGHLPYQTADGLYDPTRGIKDSERYKPAEISENPTLADMTQAALTVLEKKEKGFYLMVESGDVDWANHNNNIDNSIGAVFSGEAAFTVITDWVEKNSNWDETCLILTADHGHMMVLDDPNVLMGKRPPEADDVFKIKLAAKRKQDAIDKAKKEAAAKLKEAKAAAAKAKREAEQKAKEKAQSEKEMASKVDAKALLKTAISDAKADNKALFVYFSADW